MIFCLESFFEPVGNFQIDEMIVRENDQSFRFGLMAGFFWVNVIRRTSFERMLVPLHVSHSTTFHKMGTKVDVCSTPMPKVYQWLKT